MTKGLRGWNIVLIVLTALVVLSALVTVIYGAVCHFKITSLYSVRDFIANNLYFMVQCSGLYFVNNLLVAQVATLANVKFLILLGLNLLLLIWAISLIVRVLKPEDHFCKFRTWTVVINGIFALIALVNLHWAFDVLLNKFTIQSLIIFIATILIIAIFVIHLNINLIGMAKMKEEMHVANDIFPNNYNQTEKIVVHPKANLSFENESNKPASTPQTPPRKLPPPPPPPAQ